MAAKRVGTVLCGKWTLERVLGIGGMATVYVARHKIGRLDAIKILHPEYARAQTVRARFEQEAHVLNRFKHPGAVDVRDLDTTDDGAPFLVMELLEGRSLAQHARDTPPTVGETLRIASEVLDVLVAAHAQGIIHRDIKPDNLFVLPSGAIKVLDFGIAQLRSTDSGAPLKTKTGTTLGTVAYMPPEQLKGMPIDVRADVYGVGATMFRLLAGHPPHRADSDVELMMKVLSDPAPRLASVVGGMRADVAQIVDRALAFDRDARFADARSMRAEVDEARASPSPELAGTMVSAPSSGLLRDAAPRSRLPTRAVERPQEDEKSIAGIPFLVWIVAAACFALVLGGLLTGLAVLALRHTSAPSPSASADIPAASASASAPPAPRDEEDNDEPHHGPPPPGHGPHGHKHDHHPPPPPP